VEYYSVDRIGNVEPVNSLQVVVDTTAFIELADASGLEVGKSNYTLKGRVEPGSTVLVNGKAAQVLADGNFSFPLMLAEGTNILVVMVTDPVGNTRTVTREIIFERPTPEAPAQGPTLLDLVLVAVVVVMAMIIVMLVFRKGGPGRKK